MPVSTAVTVTLLAPTTVKITRATYTVERVYRVDLDGPEYIVIQVRLQCAWYICISKYYFLSYAILIILCPLGKSFFQRKCSVFFYVTGCEERWYGINCNQPCVGHCRDNTTCNHVTGQCDRGCAARWTGNLCDKGRTCDFTSPH